MVGVPAVARRIPLDGLDVNLIEDLHKAFHGRVSLGFGWGTLLTNDFRGMIPGQGLDPLSVVCKVVSANGEPAVKLSDNPLKAVGPKQQIERYRHVFGVKEQSPQPVVV